MLQFSMKESNNNPIRIESFPCDDKTYVITGYGGFIKNYYTAIDIPLVNVQMGLVENDYLVKNINKFQTLNLYNFIKMTIFTKW